MKLFEVFNQPLQYEWSSKLKAQFMVKGVEMFVEFKPNVASDKKPTEVLFGLEGAKLNATKFGITGTGNAAAIFSTVIDVIKTYAKTQNPHTLMMTADEASRIKLYSRMVKAISIPGYAPATQKTHFNGSTQVWEITRIDDNE